MQYQSRGEPCRRRDLFAGPDQNAARRPVFARPQRKYDDLAGATGDFAKQRVDAVGPVINVTVPFGRTIANANVTQAARSASPSTVAFDFPAVSAAVERPRS
jgi:hypothetical protein